MRPQKTSQSHARMPTVIPSFATSFQKLTSGKVWQLVYQTDEASLRDPMASKIWFLSGPAEFLLVGLLHISVNLILSCFELFRRSFASVVERHILTSSVITAAAFVDCRSGRRLEDQTVVVPGSTQRKVERIKNKKRTISWIKNLFLNFFLTSLHPLFSQIHHFQHLTLNNLPITDLLTKIESHHGNHQAQNRGSQQPVLQGSA